jgi:hypothetical protein
MLLTSALFPSRPVSFALVSRAAHASTQGTTACLSLRFAWCGLSPRFITRAELAHFFFGEQFYRIHPAHSLIAYMVVLFRGVIILMRMFALSSTIAELAS